MHGAELDSDANDFLNHVQNLVRPVCCRVQMKESEHYLHRKCSEQPEQVLFRCITVLKQRRSFCGPELVLLSQIVLRICRSTPNHQQSDTLLELLISCCQSNMPVSNAIVTQLCCALASTVLLQELFMESTRWLNRLHDSLSNRIDLQEYQALWISYICMVLSAIAEEIIHPELLRTYVTKAKIGKKLGSQQHLDKFQLSAFVLRETGSLVEVFAQYCGCNLQAQKAVMSCCTSWINLLQATLHERPLGAALNCPVAESALYSLSIWIGCGVAPTTLKWIATQHMTPDAADYTLLQHTVFSSLEVIEGLCGTCMGSDTYISCSTPFATQLQGLASDLSLAVLPNLAALIRQASLSITPKVEAVGVDIDSQLAVVQRTVSTVSECGVALLPAGIESENCHEVTPSGVALWETFITESTQAMQELICCIDQYALPNGDELKRSALKAFLPLASAIGERFSYDRNLGNMLILQSLMSATSQAIERIAVLAIHAAQYPAVLSANTPMQEQEDFDDYRSLLRDWLRDMSAYAPGMDMWVLNNARAAVEDYCQQLSSEQQQLVTPSQRIVWTVAETRLHAVTAITKSLTRFMNGSASSSSQHIDAVKQLLLTLCNGACIACRPLCRMSVVIFGEFFLLLLRRSDAALLSQNVVCALLASLHHCETACNCKAGLFSVLPTSLYGCAGLFGAEREVTDLLCLMGRWIPFRVKQDHIGAVSLVKVISALASEMASDGVRRPVFEQLPAIFRLINSDASPADKISLSIHAIRCEGLCAIEAALAAISFVQLLDSSYSSNSHRSLTENSQRLVRDAFLAAVTAANMMDLAVIIVPVCVSVIMSLRVYNSQLELKESYANHMESATNLISDLLGVPTEATEARSTAYELATLLASSCTLVNLLSVLSETMKTARDHLQLSPGKVMQLASIMRAAHSFVPYVVYGSKMNATELKALCGVVCACCHIPRVDCILPEAQMSHILCGLSELFEALPFTACEANPELLLALILPVASELIRSLGRLQPIVPATVELFNNTVQQVSTIAMSVHTCLKASNDVVAADLLLSSLLWFWADSVAATSLIPCPTGRPKVVLVATSLRAVVTAVCICCNDALVTSKEADHWRPILKIFTIVIGTLSVSVGRISAGELITDFGAAKQPSGTKEVWTWLINSGTAVELCRFMLRCLVASSGHSPIIFPSELKDHCMSIIVKMVFCVGTEIAEQLLFHSSISTDGHPVSTALGAAESSRLIWARRLGASAEAGDWKKFKSNLRMLCK